VQMFSKHTGNGKQNLKTKTKTIIVETLKFPGGWGSQISRQLAHEGSKVISHTHRPPLSPSKYSCHSLL